MLYLPPCRSPTATIRFLQIGAPCIGLELPGRVFGAGIGFACRSPMEASRYRMSAAPRVASTRSSDSWRVPAMFWLSGGLQKGYGFDWIAGGFGITYCLDYIVGLKGTDASRASARQLTTHQLW